MCSQCDPIPPTSVSRRTLLRLGLGAAAAGALLATPLRRALADDSRAQVDMTLPHRGQAKQVVFLFMTGGPSHLDTFDPKPGTATGGSTRAIDTVVTGVKVASSLPGLAKHMNHIALIRGMTSKEGNHERARYLMHTGYSPTPTVVHAGLGSIVSHELGSKDAELPEYISINGPGALPGYTGVRHAPFVVQVQAPGGDAARGKAARPGARKRPVVQDLQMPAGMTRDRRDRRLDLLGALNQRFGQQRSPVVGEAQAAMFDRARRLMDSPKNTAFDLSQEKSETLARYGKTRFGMGCLMARRLLDEGVKCVEVMMAGWDTHDDDFHRVTALNGALDPAVCALLDDLQASGRLDQTLLVWVGDFGRTPRIDTNRNGRGHYPRAWTTWMAGGGVQGGRVIGHTDATGETVADGQVTPEHFFASITHALGIDAAKTFYTRQGRPIQIVYKDGRVVKDLFA
jgi:hypothetical protein